MTPGGTGSESPWRRLARTVAPELLEQVMDDSRREAAAVVRARLTAALVEEMEQLLVGSTGRPVEARVEASATEPGPAAPPESPPKPAGPPESAAAAREDIAPVATHGPDLAGWYLYGITREEMARTLPLGTGVDGARIEVLAAGRLAALVSPITAGRSWGVDDAGEVDLDVLAPRAREHERVLEDVLERGAVLPVRFGVMYPDLERVRMEMVDRAAEMEAALARIDDHVEWGLTVSGGPTDSPAEAAPAPSTGSDYLSRRRAQRLAAEEGSARALAAITAIHDALMDVAADGVVQGSGTGRRTDARILLRASYLVPRAATDAFRRAAESQLRSAPAELRLSGELSGPWPAYHFCDISLGGVPA